MNREASNGELHAVAQRVAEFSNAGGAAFDPPALAFVEHLVTRATTLGGGAATLLVGRALARLEALEAAYAASRARAQKELDALARVNVGDIKLAEAFQRGDHKTVLFHAGRRARIAKRRVRSPVRGDEARSLFRSSAAEAKAAVTVARAVAALPEASGPYNGLVLAVRALQALSGMSSRFLAAYLSGLDDVAALAMLPPPPRVQQAGKRRGRS